MRRFQSSRRTGATKGLASRLAGVVLIDRHKLIAVGKRKRAEDDGVNGGEDSAVGADAEGESEDDGERERRRVAQEAQGGVEVEAQRF